MVLSEFVVHQKSGRFYRFSVCHCHQGIEMLSVKLYPGTTRPSGILSQLNFIRTPYSEGVQL